MISLEIIEKNIRASFFNDAVVEVANRRLAGETINDRDAEARKIVKDREAKIVYEIDLAKHHFDNCVELFSLTGKSDSATTITLDLLGGNVAKSAVALMKYLHPHHVSNSRASRTLAFKEAAAKTFNDNAELYTKLAEIEREEKEETDA